MTNRNKFFTNTYITGDGRTNYLKINTLEDPLFTSFTFDIDYTSSPLFYTINYSDYGYPQISGIGERIETALSTVWSNMKSKDDGYDLLPLLSASILDNTKFGFGIQQNVYTDMPLYGATEYIYMVDKRNGSANQNDVRFNVDAYSEGDQNPIANNSYKLGDSVKSIVNDSDKMWAEQRKKQVDEHIKNCDNIQNEKKKEHEENKKNIEKTKKDFDNVTGKVVINKKEQNLNVDQFKEKITECEEKNKSFEKFKKDIIDWINKEIQKVQKEVEDLYKNNKCIEKISNFEKLSSLDDATKKKYYEELKKEFKSTFVHDQILGDVKSFMVSFNNIFNKFVTFSSACKDMYKTCKEDDKNSLLLENDKSDNRATIRGEIINSKFTMNLIEFGLFSIANTDDKKNTEDKNQNVNKFKICANQTKELPEWLTKLSSGFIDFINACVTIANKEDNYKELSNGASICEDWYKMISALMSYQCDESSFVEFDSPVIKENNENLKAYNDAYDEIRTKMFGAADGEICDIENPTGDSMYGQYLLAQDKYNNDDYSQAVKSKQIALSGQKEIDILLNSKEEEIEEKSEEKDLKSNKKTTTVKNNTKLNSSKSIVSSQTVMDMLGFISGMKKMTTQYPYIIQGITGLDIAYNKHYGIKDPYLGSGEDKITLTCLESLDLRVSSMFNRYFNAIYDRQYRRERVPVNLRRFNCYVYVHDVRNFVSNLKGSYENRIIELVDMYYSVIEFRFYDCEIVPEETGNIFNNISNEAPTEMIKTNFTFTYGNCVVNFIPRNVN